MDKIKFYIGCSGECATISRESIDEVYPYIKLSQEDKERGYVEFKKMKITGTFYEGEKRPEKCPKCEGDFIKYGVSNIPGSKVIGPAGAISSANMADGLQALWKLFDHPCAKCGESMSHIWGCYKCFIEDKND